MQLYGGASGKSSIYDLKLVHFEPGLQEENLGALPERLGAVSMLYQKSWALRE